MPSSEENVGMAAQAKLNSGPLCCGVIHARDL